VPAVVAVAMVAAVVRATAPPLPQLAHALLVAARC
jgi:hypothetical protein